MGNIFEIVYIGFITLLVTIVNPIFWLVIFIVYSQYKKFGKMEKESIGINKEPIWKRVLMSTIIGLVGGLIGSILVVSLGITIKPDDFKYILILAILLMLIHPRFICFSYSGGIISLSSLIFGFPNVNVSSIIAIVAILHMVESYLIYMDGDRFKIPIFIERDDKIIGGFNMMRFWPIPFIVLLVASQSIGSGGVPMPEWWPLFKPDNIIDTKDISFVMVGVIAALGYGDMVFTDYPENKVKYSARNLFLYSIVLLILAVVSSHIYLFKYIAALFSPIVHEILIKIGQNKELNGEPIFVPNDKGVKILDVLPKGIGDRIGLRTGDIIHSINGQRVFTKEDINLVLYNLPSYIWIDYYNTNGEFVTKDIHDYRSGIRGLDILIIPKHSSYLFEIGKADSLGKRLLNLVNKIFKK